MVPALNVAKSIVFIFVVVRKPTTDPEPTRAGEGVGGAMVNAMVYQDRYNTARAEMRALRKTGEAKKCSPSDLNPPPSAPPGGRDRSPRSIHHHGRNAHQSGQAGMMAHRVTYPAFNGRYQDIGDAPV